MGVMLKERDGRNGRDAELRGRTQPPSTPWERVRGTAPGIMSTDCRGGARGKVKFRERMIPNREVQRKYIIRE